MEFQHPPVKWTQISRSHCYFESMEEFDQWRQKLSLCFLLWLVVRLRGRRALSDMCEERLDDRR